MFETIYIGVVDGWHTWEVVDSDGKHVGWNQSETGPEGD
jgi:hypothetical protein